MKKGIVIFQEIGNIQYKIKRIQEAMDFLEHGTEKHKELKETKKQLMKELEELIDKEYVDTDSLEHVKVIDLNETTKKYLNSVYGKTQKFLDSSRPSPLQIDKESIKKAMNTKYGKKVTLMVFDEFSEK